MMDNLMNPRPRGIQLYPEIIKTEPQSQTLVFAGE